MNFEMIAEIMNKSLQVFQIRTASGEEYALNQYSGGCDGVVCKGNK